MERGEPVRLLLGAVTLVAAVATVGSLYFSEAMGLVPCDLCWVQRILMYPLVIVVGVATLEGRTAVWRTGLPLSLLGAAVAAYHSYLQLSPDATCTLDGGCTTILWRGFGVFTIPRLTLVAFLLISLGLVGAALLDRRGR
ncbi:disulfide bond formation protein B [Halorubrum vacuolatum]|uniref:Disulfide bond formation protein DsbB n=1 Tax=Halorubrum vacuolatum TaxID=63740 RepID=A0A238X1I4_HALVU|nr:disulfide bond formation protein B [Halorubrum vacuolatum]SNR52602.1 disulfide bond formation protein DsbB [Halorubrum vacuolatum]